MKHDENYYVKQAMYLIKQFPDLDFASFKKLLRKKAGSGLTCDFEELYNEYLETQNDSVQ